jgi:hypothetical protein
MKKQRKHYTPEVRGSTSGLPTIRQSERIYL